MTSAVRLIRSQQLAQTAPYAYAATTAVPARAVWVAGACPLDASGATVAAGDYAGQTHQVMRNLATALADAGAALTDIAKTTVYVASARREDLVTAWNVYKEYMGAHDAPSTLLGVTVLGYDEQLVEVEAVAVVPETCPLQILRITVLAALVTAQDRDRGRAWPAGPRGTGSTPDGRSPGPARRSRRTAQPGPSPRPCRTARDTPRTG